MYSIKLMKAIFTIYEVCFITKFGTVVRDNCLQSSYASGGSIYVYITSRLKQYEALEHPLSDFLY